MNDLLNNNVHRFLDSCEDVLKNFPLDAQRQASRYYETDCRHSHILNKLKNFTKKTKDFTSSDEQRLKKMLMESLDLSDKKVNITECLLDMVGTNMRSLDMNYKEVETAKLRLINSNKRMPETGSDSVDVQNINNANKRPKRNVTKPSTTLNKNVEMKARVGRKPSTKQNKKKTASNKKSKAQPAKNKKIVSESESDDSDDDDDDDLQPTYCICEEISYGDMIGCDNDLCPLEWCHFGCVSISKKPKGDWYCPFCRGTNAKTMKPKSVFIKELEEYNKRKEEKWSMI